MQENQLSIFENPEFGKLRVIVKDNGTIFFNLQDVAWGLKYVKKAKERLYLRKDRIANICKSLGITVVVQSGQPIEIAPDLDFEQLYIPEDGLYELAFESHASGARKFRKWVTQEVLPTIRQTGAYIKDTKKLLALAVLEANKIIQEHEQKIKELQPKAEYYDKLVDRNLLTNFRDTAKELNIPERKLINLLLQKKILYRDAKGNLRPYAEYKEYFELKEWTKNGAAGVQTLVNPKGREFLMRLLNREGKIIELEFGKVIR
ncbi:phage antirepressor protein [Caldicellulosiruptor acetigenus I77R1B]|uniref:Phage antirepressor protein n=2 Tax=Caldicellulosiruptor acetigenus TaxID=301953 RepID=G2PT99_9FIRM|nr:phage antirepressor Ant [Caldicellulosiruptor acetigenus]ADQ40216.1 phage antirepressor protein [Caldicellulosiruptor acetigenus I77R1B]AEM74258.1 phage antirepressor protein [Caldicellulosiruptor acetigenus 6A]